jgi:hypothetical protein
MPQPTSRKVSPHQSSGVKCAVQRRNCSSCSGRTHRVAVPFVTSGEPAESTALSWRAHSTLLETVISRTLSCSAADGHQLAQRGQYGKHHARQERDSGA